MAVRFPQLCSLFVVEKRQERVAPPLGHLGHGMQERAGKNDRAAGRRLEALWAVFRKADFATLEVFVQVDRHRKTPVRRSPSGVVAMRVEVGLVLGGVAGNDIALHTRHVEAEYPLDLGGDAPLDARQNG